MIKFKTQSITKQDAICLIKNLCKDFDLSIPEIKIFEKTDKVSGYYKDSMNNKFRASIVLHNLDIATVIHEFCHHLEFERDPNTCSTHRITFHRICFEVRDWCSSVYGFDCWGINGYEHTKSFEKALYEWKCKKFPEYYK